MRIQAVARFDAPAESPGAIVLPDTVMERIQCWWEARVGRLYFLGFEEGGRQPTYLRLALPADAGPRLQ